MMAAPAQDRPPLSPAALRDPQAPLVVLDLCSVETYLLAQPLAWLAEEQAGAIWCPLASGPAPLDGDRAAAERAAERLQLPLTWPGRHPEPVFRATRVAALACARGFGAACIFGMSRLAFGGGADLEDPEQYLLAVEEAGVTPQEAMLAARAGDTWDARLRVLAQELRQLGIVAGPALRWQGHLHLGTREIAALLAHSPHAQPILDLF
jgi:2-hydroxychromene-2-carboxylate isomerase